MLVVDKFKVHIESVEKLMNFDREVLDVAVQNIRELRDRLVQHHQLGNPHLTADRTLKIIERIRENDSLRPRYRTIFNQGLVLLVSYFASSVHDLFRLGVREALGTEADSPVLKEQLRFTLGELRDMNFDLRDSAPDLLILSKDISFQDMQSIARAFKDNLEITISKDETVNDIIVAQACRHAIVHAGGVVSDRTIRQIATAVPRQIKTELTSGETIQFSAKEVSLVAVKMLSYVEKATEQVSDKFGIEV